MCVARSEQLNIGHCNFYLLGKGGYVFGSVGLSVCLADRQHYSKRYEQIGMKFYGGAPG